MTVRVLQVLASQDAASIDPAVAKKAAEEAEERRLAEIRSHGTMVTPHTFAEWKACFEAEMALARCRTFLHACGLMLHRVQRDLPADVGQHRICNAL